MNTQLHATPYYPFTLDGPLCPLLNDTELLSGFYAEDSLHHGIKQFCKRTTWPAKPVVSYALGPEKLKELLISLFNSPVARATLRRQSEKDRYTYLDSAIWLWLSIANPVLSQRLSGCCDDVKGRLFIRCEAWAALLTKIQSEKPDAATVPQLAYVALAFAMLQPDDRYALGEAFLSAFPEYTVKILGP